MRKEEFISASLLELEKFSGIHRSRWYKYFMGDQMSERNLYKYANAVNMSPGEFLDALNARRASNELQKSAISSKINYQKFPNQDQDAPTA